jgi:hypothetical protein
MEENIKDHDLLIRIDENVKALMDVVPDTKLRVTSLEVCLGAITERTENCEKEIEKLRSSNSVHNWINSLGVGVASILAILFKD